MKKTIDETGKKIKTISNTFSLISPISFSEHKYELNWGLFHFSEMI